MGVTNPTGDWLQDPNYLTANDGAEYMRDLDNALAVSRRASRAFAPHAQTVPNMTVRIDEGYVFDPATRVLTEVAAQNSATIVAPTTNPRIDRIVIDQLTGTVSVITGTEAASPVAPLLTVGTLPVAQVLLDNSPATTAITNALISDERALSALGQPVGISAFAAYNSASDLNVTGTGTVVTVDYDTEIVDLGGDFAADTFTAPVKGLYGFSAWAALSGLVSATGVNIDLVTSNHTYRRFWANPPDGEFGVGISVPAAVMDALDTARVDVLVQGMAGDTADVLGSPTVRNTAFSGILIGSF